MTTFRAGIMPGVLSPVTVDGTPTVRQALERAGLNPTGYDVQMQGSLVTNFDTLVPENANIMLFKTVKGNLLSRVFGWLFPQFPY